MQKRVFGFELDNNQEASFAGKDEEGELGAPCQKGGGNLPSGALPVLFDQARELKKTASSGLLAAWQPTTSYSCSRRPFSLPHFYLSPILFHPPTSSSLIPAPFRSLSREGGEMMMSPPPLRGGGPFQAANKTREIFLFPRPRMDGDDGGGHAPSPPPERRHPRPTGGPTPPPKKKKFARCC